MKNRKTKNILIIGLLLGACYMSWNFYFKDYMQQDTVNIHTFPKAFGDWFSEELTITDEEYAILETRNALVRKYSTPEGKEVYFFTVYSQNNRKVSHPPEICYTGGGITVLDNKPVEIKLENKKLTIPARRLLLDQGRYQQVAFYWFKIGDTFTSSYWKQQVQIALNAFSGKNSSSALIRISTVIKNNDEAQADRDVQEFANLIIPSLFEHLP